MAPNCSGSYRTSFSIQIDELILVGNQAYIFEPPLTEIARRLRYYDALVPYSNSGNMFPFTSPLPRLVKKPGFLEISSLAIMGGNLRF